MPLTEIAVKEYTALLTQLSTTAPTPTILLNTLGTITWTRTSTGVYKGTLTGQFTENKTIITYNNNLGIDVGIISFALNENEIIVNSYNGTTPGDSILYYTPIKIQVYL